VSAHEYGELSVTEHAFEIGLSFNGVPERLLVPFAAVKGFYHPSVPFGLQFEAQPKPAAMPGPVAVKPASPDAASPVPLPAPQPEPAAEAAEPAPQGEQRVVSRDAFRKTYRPPHS